MNDEKVVRSLLAEISQQSILGPGMDALDDRFAD
jgi:hypothetical protein